MQKAMSAYGIDGLALKAECQTNGFPSKLYAKENGKSQLDDCEEDGLLISRILVGTVWTSSKRYAACVGRSSCCRGIFKKKRVKKKQTHFKNYEKLFRGPIYNLTVKKNLATLVAT